MKKLITQYGRLKSEIYQSVDKPQFCIKQNWGLFWKKEKRAI